jgi:hypothetical protein
MSNKHVFEVTLLAVLLLLLAELLFRETLGQSPALLQWSGMLLAIASTPWSLFALELVFRPTEDPVGEVLRNAAFMLIMAIGVALNAVLIKAFLGWLWDSMRRRG